MFVERLWRSVKYEEVYLEAYKTVVEDGASITSYLRYFITPANPIRALTGRHLIRPISTGRRSSRRSQSG